MKNVLVLLFIFWSCNPGKEVADREDTKKGGEMSNFKLIDDKLNKFAKELNATIATNSSPLFVNGVPVSSANREERRIVWIDNSIHKGVLIVPFILPGDSTSSKWSFTILAWLEDETVGTDRPLWIRDLHKNVEFKTIETEIDQLLSTSKRNFT